METTARPARPKVPVPQPLFLQHNGPMYRTPVDLQVTKDPALRFLVVGACLAEAFGPFAAKINPDYKGDFVLVNNFDEFPVLPEEQLASYDFQIIHIPLRTILGNGYFHLPDTIEAHEAFLKEMQEYLGRYLANSLKLNKERKLLSFVLGFMVPQQNPLGRFRPRYDARNIMHVIERLNMFVASEIARYENVHFVDTDMISSGIGKRACQDDSVWSFTHGTTLSDGDHDHDLARMQPPMEMHKHYAVRWLEFFEALMHEIFAMHRTIRQQDPVKLVAVDLDDTMWRGVAAEGSLGMTEGWPMGFVETLIFLKKRGVLLAILSKNDERFIRSQWDQLVQGQIPLSDFAAIKMNFRSKAQNLKEILAEVNLKPQHAVFVDDNPGERALVQSGVPGVRVLGSHLYYLKRVLLWSPQTQQSVHTAESANRTEMVQAQIQRETVRKGLTHEEFLATLELRVTLSEVATTREARMSRALELFNKTTQVNTTGVRYSFEEFNQRLAEGRRLWVVEAEDRFTRYGLIGAAWLHDGCVEHMVMSCRALGLGIEEAFIATMAKALRQEGRRDMGGALIQSPSNLACHNVFARSGFVRDGANEHHWSCPLDSVREAPAHVSLVLPEVFAALAATAA